MIDLKKKLSLFIIILLIFSVFPSFLGLGEDNGPTWEETKTKLERLFAEPKWRNLDKQIIEMVEYPQDPNWASKVKEKIGKTAFSDLSEKKKEQKIVELITGRRGRDRIKTTDGSVLNGSLIVKSFQIKIPYLEEPKDVALKYIDDIEFKTGTDVAVMVNGDRLSGEFLFDSLELKAPFGTVTIKKAILQTIHVAPAIEEFPQIPKPSNTKTVSLKNGDTITGDVHFHEERDFFTFNTQYSEPINFKESMVRSINLAPQIKGRDKVTDPFGNEHVGQVTATSFKLKSFYSTMKIRTSDVTKMKATYPASSWQYKKMVRGIPSTTIFTENWESGDTARWNITDYNEGSKGVTNKPEAGEPFEGQYVMELRGDYSHINKNLNLKKYPSVTIMIWGQVRSLDNPNEYMDMDFYDGQNWHNGVIRFTQEDNTKGYQFRIFHVPENWKSNKNKIRFYTRASGSGDYFLIDSIVVAG